MGIGADGMDGLGVHKRVAAVNSLETECAIVPPLLVVD